MIYENYINVLNIDLENKKLHIEKRKDLVKYIGGVGVASKLLEENMYKDLDSLDPKQPIVFAIGPLNGIYPVMTKTVAMFISPLTNELGESYAGGRMGITMFNAGIDAMVIKGKSEKPIYLTINPNDVAFRDARLMWGTGIDNTGSIIREYEEGNGKRSIIHIGEAGENQVSFASVCVDKYRHFGRLGLGAVFGSKNLKAITIIGGKDIPIKDYKKYFKSHKTIFEKCTDTDLMKKYHDEGTPVNVEVLNDLNGLPTYNMQKSSFENASEISGEAFANNNLVRKMACAGCPVGCIHIGQFRREFADHGHEYETVSVSYDYELIYALGSFLGIDKTDKILELIEQVEIVGVDAMSAGVVLGWATEALEKELITKDQTIVDLKFGDWENYKVAIKYLGNSKNKFYKDLGKGVNKVSKIYGGEDFAMHICGNEMPGYHTGYGALVGAAVGARHSHLCNGGYSFDQGIEKLTPDQIVDKLFKEEIERCMINSLVMCLFARKVYDRDTIKLAFSGIEREVTDEDLDNVGLLTYKTKLRIKKSLGFDLLNVKIPKRYFKTPSLNGIMEKSIASDMIKKYRDKIENLGYDQ